MSGWELVVEWNDKNWPRWRTSHIGGLGTAMASELGEVCGLLKVIIGGGTKKKPMPTTEDIAEEMADLYIYMVLTMECLNISETDFWIALANKIGKLNKRMEAKKAPEGG